MILPILTLTPTIAPYILMSNANTEKLTEAIQDTNNKELLCQGRCNLQFQATETISKQTEEGTVDKILEGMLFCTCCAWTKDVEFE
jgi:hypothetical protein